MTIAPGIYEADVEDEDLDDEEDDFYPVSDGKPMGETELHRDLMIYTIEALKVYFAGKGRGYASGNNFVYWQEGSPKAVVCPDAYAVYGVQPYQRDVYKVWEEGGITPAVVFEFTSRKTRREDQQKRNIYENVLRVPELFFFDPTGKRRKIRLQGYRLTDTGYQALSLVNNRMYSEQLGLDLVQDGKFLRFAYPETGEWLLTPFEQAAKANQEQRRADEEARNALRESRRADYFASQAEIEAKAREEAEKRALAEAEARAATEAELERLRAELERLKQT